MKKELLTISMLIVSGLAFAQVGINNTDPKATFDVTAKATDASTAEGIIAPRLTGDEIQGKDAKYTSDQTGALVYATSAVSVPSGTKTTNITSAGYYYFDGTQWISATSSTADLRLVGTRNHISQDAGVGSNGTSAGTGTDNFIVGSGAGNALTSGIRNTFLGTTVGTLTTSGSRNTIIGAPAFTANTTGSDNAGYGVSSLRFNTTGTHNTAMGPYSMLSNTTGTHNTAIGQQSLYANTSGIYNIAVGDNALFANSTGDNNIGIGKSTGSNVTTGANNIVIGNNLSMPSGSASNQINIGNLIYANDADGTGGIVSTGNVGVGVKVPSNKLHVASTANPLRLEGLQAGVATDRNLVVDANGVVKTAVAGVAPVSTEPWFGSDDNMAATTNTENIYHMGNIGIGTNDPQSSLVIRGTANTNGDADLDTYAFGNEVTVFHLNRAAGTPDAPAAMSTEPFNKNSLASIEGSGYDGTTYQKAARIRLGIFNNVGGISTGPGDMPGFIELSTTEDGTATPLPRMTIIQNGDVGIGTDKPKYRLHVKGNTGLNPVRIEGLQAGLATDEVLSVDSNGVVRKTAAAPAADLRLVGTRNHISQDAGVGSNGTSAGTGTDNFIVGSGAGNALTSGIRNTFLGTTVGALNTTGSKNTIVGMPAFTANTTGEENSGFGISTFRYNTTGSRNTALGSYVLLLNTTGSDNTAVGRYALYENTTGSRNIGIGISAGLNVGSSSNNIAIGNEAWVGNGALSNQISIGNLIYANGVDGTTSNISSGNVGIGVKAPAKRLHIANPGGATGSTSVRLNDIPTYANDAAAGAGGLQSGDLYKTMSGTDMLLKIKI